MMSKSVKENTIFCASCGKKMEKDEDYTTKEILGVDVHIHTACKGKNSKGIFCPKCGYPQYCGCSSCVSKVPEGIKPYTWKYGELVVCSGCGFTAHCDFWLSLDGERSGMWFLGELLNE